MATASVRVQQLGHGLQRVRNHTVPARRNETGKTSGTVIGVFKNCLFQSDFVCALLL